MSGGLVKHLAKNANWQHQSSNGRLNRRPVEPPKSARRGDVIQQADEADGKNIAWQTPVTLPQIRRAFAELGGTDTRVKLIAAIGIGLCHDELTRGSAPRRGGTFGPRRRIKPALPPTQNAAGEQGENDDPHDKEFQGQPKHPPRDKQEKKQRGEGNDDGDSG